MKRLAYLTAASIVALLAGCEQAPETPQEHTETIPVAAQPGAVAESPYYALRPLDDSWPGMVAEGGLSGHLLATNYYIVLDGSGSMSESHCADGSTKMAVAKTAITQFAGQIPADANLALYSFDVTGPSQRVDLAVNNRESFFNQVNAIEPGGNTPLATALSYGYQALKNKAAKQLGYGEYHLVVVTDGIATENEAPDRIIQTILQESPVLIHSIGFCINQRHSLNQPGMTAYTAASNAEELQHGLQAVLAESTDFNSDAF